MIVQLATEEATSRTSTAVTTGPPWVTIWT